MMSELSSELADTREQASQRLKTESDEAGLMMLRQQELEAELRQLKQQNRGGCGGIEAGPVRLRQLELVAELRQLRQNGRSQHI